MVDKVSIVTVVYNDCQHIEDTILSVLGLDYDNMEYIIIDGGSNDGTVDVIKKYSDRISYWVSEPDRGIYDAMNKGIEHSTGEWVNFMNSGDMFASPDVLYKIFHNADCCDYDVLYGDVVMRYLELGDITRRFDNADKSTISTNLCHQSTFTKAKWLKRYHYDITYKIAADVNFFYTIEKEQKARFGYVPVVIAIYEAESGTSARNLKLMYDEYMRIHGLKPYSLQWCKAKIRNQFKMMVYNLPFGISKSILKYRFKKLYER